MKSAYYSRHNEFRKAFIAEAGRFYDFTVPEGTRRIYLALTLNFFPAKAGVRKFLSRVHRRLMKSALYAEVEVRQEEHSEKTKILLTGFTPDHFMLNDLWNDW